MMDIKKLAGNWIFWALLVSVLGRLIVAYPLNSNLLDGTDSTVYIHRIWFAANSNQLEWDSSWYGGYPSLKYYAPINYLFGSFFALFFDSVIAYKIIINFFFLLTPIIFYLFAKEFLDRKQLSISVILFSFFPINIYYFWNGNYVAILNLSIVLLFWREFKLYLDTNTKKHLGFSGIFCGISLLTHQLTAIFGIYLILFWSIFKYRKLALKPIIIAFLISSFWLVPFIFEYGGNDILKTPEVSSFITNAVFHLGITNFLVILILLILAIIYTVSLKNKETNSFLFMLFLIFIVIFLTLYNRILIFLSIPIALILAKIFSKNRLFKVFVILSLFVFIFVFYTFKPLTFIEGHETWELPVVENRVVYYPSNQIFCLPGECDEGEKIMYIPYLAPISKQEILGGWFPQSQNVPQLKGKKIQYIEKTHNFLNLNLTDKELYSLLNEGYVNTVVINKFYIGYMDFFTNSNLFVKINETDFFAVFELNPKSSYIEIDNLPINYTIEKNGNEIKLYFECKKGILKIKEGYDNFWEGYLNKEKINLKLNEYGFMETCIDNEGYCEIQMKHETKKEYYVFYLISVAVLLLIILKRDYIPKVKSIFY